MCAFGLCAPDTGEPTKKSTRITTNSKEAARLLNIKRPGCESHRTIESSIREEGKTIFLSEFCGGYTRDFVLTTLDGFMHDLQPMSYLSMIVSKRNILDRLKDGAAERLLLPNPQKNGRTDYTPEDENTKKKKKKKKRRKFADELRAASAAGPRPMNTRSMASSSTSSSSGTNRKAEETPAPELDEQDLTNRYMEDLFEEVPYIDPMDEQQDDDNNNDNYAETPQQRPTTTTYRPDPPEETPYPQERRRDPRDDETPAKATEATASTNPELLTDEHEHLPHMEVDQSNYEESPDDDHHEEAEQVPVEEAEEQVAPRPRDHDLEVIPTMLDEENFHGNDLAGGEGDVPLAIMRETDPVVRREVRNGHYNLGRPSTATLLRIKRRSGASDAAQRYAGWWKCPLCAQRQAPRAVNPTTAPYRPTTFNLMIGCDVKAIYDADGVKYDALNTVDMATGFQILAILDGPGSTVCAEKL